MAVRGLVSAALLVLLAGCGGGAASPAGDFDPSRIAFRLHVWDESLVGGAQANVFTYFVDYPDGNWCTVDVQVIGAVSLKALYFDLAYDSERLEPVGVDFNDNIAAEDARLEQVQLGEPGRMTASEVASGILAEGYSGSGKLARVLFRRK